jgi:beta-phosphoglucomutase-like phosphatase (HAD superfamily)
MAIGSEQPGSVILFDLDGTLIDSAELILRRFRHWWESVCGFIHSPEADRQSFGRPLGDPMHEALGTGNRDCDRSQFDPRDVAKQLLIECRRTNLANHDRLAGPFLCAVNPLTEFNRVEAVPFARIAW